MASSVTAAAARPFPFAAVIFDMDGVIVDSEAAYKEELRAFAKHLGILVTEQVLNSRVGASHQDFLRLLVDWYARAGHAFTADEAMNAYRTWADQRPIDFAALLMPGVPETLASLRERGVHTALASSSPMSDIRTVLEACRLEDAFEVLVSGEQFRESKPNPEIYLHTLDLLKLPADACCCVEDSVPGIAAGKAAGLTVFARREERFGFSQAAADVIIDQVPDLLSAAYELRG